MHIFNFQYLSVLHSDIEEHTVDGKTWYVYHNDEYIWFFDSPFVLKSCFIHRRHTTNPAYWDSSLLNARCIKRYHRLLESIWYPPTIALELSVEQNILDTLKKCWENNIDNLNGLIFCKYGERLWLPESLLFYNATTHKLCSLKMNSTQEKATKSLSDRKILMELLRYSV